MADGGATTGAGSQLMSRTGPILPDTMKGQVRSKPSQFAKVA
jgi:hypothetical protein